MQAESVTYSDFTTTQGPFSLRGGVYSFRAASGSWNSRTLALQAILPDGASAATVNNLDGTAASLSANGGIDGLYLPAGQYQLTASGAPTDPWYASVASIAT